MEHTETATRDKERTRRAIIDAAAQLLHSHGASVSLADIASAAGMSKGALTHHFPSRAALEEAILLDASHKMWEATHAQVDPNDNRPGKLLRGYIRALTDDDPAVREIFSPNALLLVIGSGQPVQQVLAADAAKWRNAFNADGVDPATSLTIRCAAEGLAAAMGTPYLTPAELRSARARLLEMAEPG